MASRIQNLDEIEEAALAGDSLVHRMLAALVNEVRRLSHELEDPQFLYAGSRIHRHAILCRQATIDALRAEVKALKKEPAGG